ncbi:DegT/DnrJ/EryC1/StrS family aminotransferase [Micromonospora sp. WMMD737]|uniref:DegT/DnrJ/EryC1/StrS family aminotransferase n=1 Tax=Micromonospora sp. WMMD737 TaxID=3404113 RepID=UPI003B93F61F
MTHQVPFHKVNASEDEIEAMVRTLRSGWLTTGPQVREFESEFARAIGVKDAIAVSSGTAALHLLLLAAGIGPGDEVIVPTLTFTATAASVAHVGARPVLADVDPDSLMLTGAEVERRLTSQTRAVLTVHFAGLHSDVKDLTAAAGPSRLVFEDAAHALPSSRDGRHAGAVSDGAAFSFYATKTLSTGEGGMVILRDREQAARARRLSLHGMSKGALDRYGSGSWRYDIEDLGFKYNMTDVAAALGRQQLTTLTARRNARRTIVDAYDSAFASHPALQLPSRLDEESHSWHLYVLRLNLERLHCSRDEFLDQLRQRGIGANVHFIPLHLHSAYQRRYAYRPGDFPQAEGEYQRMISLPLWPGMTARDISAVTTAVLDIAEAELKR